MFDERIFGVPWSVLVVFALAVAAVYFVVDMGAGTTGIRCLLVRWAHPAVWVLLAHRGARDDQAHAAARRVGRTDRRDGRGPLPRLHCRDAERPRLAAVRNHRAGGELSAAGRFRPIDQMTMETEDGG